MICGTGLDLLQSRLVSKHCLLHWSGQQQHLLQLLQALGAQEMLWAQALDKRPWLQMYTVSGNCTPLGWQITEGSPSWTWQAGGGSFLLLPRRCSQQPVAVNFQHLWKLPGRSSRSCYHFSLPATSLSGQVAVCIALVCGAQCSMPATKPNLQCLQQNDRAMIRQTCHVKWQDIVTTRSSELLARLGIEDLDLILKERRLSWYGHVERSNGVQSRQPLTYRSMESVGPRWQGSSWQRGIAESGSSQLSTLMIDIPGDLV